MKNKLRTRITILLVLVFISTACVSGSIDQSDTIADTESPETEPTEAIPESEDPTTAPEQPPQPTLEPTEASLQLPEPEDLIIHQYGFGQDGVLVNFGFIVENPNSDIALENTTYLITAYNSNGEQIEALQRNVHMLYPEQILGVSDFFMTNQDVEVDSIEIELTPGTAFSADNGPAFKIESTDLIYGQYSNHVTGLITNQHEIEYQNISVSAIVYDADGNIIGSGQGSRMYLLPQSNGGVKIPVTFSGEAAAVELYANTTKTSLFYQQQEIPSGAHELILQDYGFGQAGKDVGFGFFLQNPNLNYAIETTRFEIISFSEDGVILDVKEGLVPVVLPGQTFGFAGDIFIEKDRIVDHIQVQLKTGIYIEANQFPLIISQNVILIPDDYNPSVAGEIINPFDFELTGLKTYAIVLDEYGSIIGGGYASGLSVVALGSAETSAAVHFSGVPAKVQIYVIVNLVSDLEK